MALIESKHGFEWHPLGKVGRISTPHLKLKQRRVRGKSITHVSGSLWSGEERSLGFQSVGPFDKFFLNNFVIDLIQIRVPLDLLLHALSFELQRLVISLHELLYVFCPCSKYKWYALLFHQVEVNKDFNQWQHKYMFHVQILYILLTIGPRLELDAMK